MISFKINKITKLFLIFSYLICWLSISSSYDDLLILKKNKINYFDVINFFRHALIYLCFFFLIGIFFQKKNYINFKDNLIYIFLSIYFAIQILGLVITPNSIENLSFILSSLTIILTVFLIDNFFSKDEKKILIFITILILSTVFLLTISNLFKDFVSGKYNFYGQFSENEKLFLNKDTPRSSGTSRTCLIIIIISYIIYNIFNKYNLSHKFFKISLLTFILLYQSRLILSLTFLTLIIIFVYENKITLKNIFKYFIFYFLFPLIISFLLANFYNEKRYQSKVNNAISKFGSLEKMREENIVIEKDLILRVVDDFSSGRFDDWKEIMKIINTKNVFIGYGSQGDRYLINQSASNGILHALTSSGVLGLVFYIIFLIILLTKIFKIFYKFHQENYLNFYSSLVILTLLLRSLLESSFAVFGIDLIVLLTFISIIKISKKT